MGSTPLMGRGRPRRRDARRLGLGLALPAPSPYPAPKYLHLQAGALSISLSSALPYVRMRTLRPCCKPSRARTVGGTTPPPHRSATVTVPPRCARASVRVADVADVALRPPMSMSIAQDTGSGMGTYVEGLIRISTTAFRGSHYPLAPDLAALSTPVLAHWRAREGRGLGELGWEREGRRTRLGPRGRATA